jgi:hypothetical protein
MATIGVPKLEKTVSSDCEQPQSDTQKFGLVEVELNEPVQ